MQQRGRKETAIKQSKEKRTKRTHTKASGNQELSDFFVIELPTFRIIIDVMCYPIKSPTISGKTPSQ